MKLNAIFGAHMVFAAGLPIRVYGNGKGEAEITFASTTLKVVSDSNEWFVEFPAMEYGGPYELKFVCGEQTIVYDDIYVGEVYLFAGQSNMQFKLKESTFDKDAYEGCDKIRLYSTERIEKADRFTPEDGWVTATKENVGDWSALGYLTSIEIAKSKGIAVGAIVCYQGASVIESWVPTGSFERIGICLKDEDKYHDHFEPDFLDWNMDGVLYSFALSQIIPFSVSSVVWYQGESDTSFEEAKVYKQELSALIDIWRSDFANSKLPFVIVQIADCDSRSCDAWKLIQEHQYNIQFEKDNVKTVISADVCETDDIHPPTKHILAKRIADALIDFE